MVHVNDALSAVPSKWMSSQQSKLAFKLLGRLVSRFPIIVSSSQEASLVCRVPIEILLVRYS